MVPVTTVPPKGSAAIAESCPPRSITLPTGRKTEASSVNAVRGTLSQQPKRETAGEEMGRRRGLESAVVVVAPVEEGEGPARRRESWIGCTAQEITPFAEIRFCPIR